jgi:hypothetical protein
LALFVALVAIVALIAIVNSFWPESVGKGEVPQTSTEPVDKNKERIRVKVPRPTTKSSQPKTTEADDHRESEAIEMLSAEKPLPPENDAGVLMFEPDSPDLDDEINAAVFPVLTDMVDCIHQWAETVEDNEFEGEVVMSFQLDRYGMDTIEVLDVVDVPEEQLICFGEVLYTADWPGTTVPIEIEYPFKVSFDDKE